MPDGDEEAGRLQFLTDVGRLLWPSPAWLTFGPPRPLPGVELVGDFLLLSGRNRPRLLVPTGNRHAAAGAVRHYGEQGGRRARVVNRTAALAVRTGLAEQLLRERVRIHAPLGTPRDNIETYLAGVLHQPVHLGMHVSAPRANRKPVLQVLTADGRTAAYVKIGIDDLTARLVSHEAASLRTLSSWRLSRMQVPSVISYDRWKGLGVLVLSALPVWQRRVGEGKRREDSLLELAAVGSERRPLAGSAWWHGLRSRQRELDTSASALRLQAAAATLEQIDGARELGFGPCHGDWTPWNAVVVADAVLAWDWERFDPAGPHGHDALHFALQRRIVGAEQPAPDAVRAVIANAARLLAPHVRVHADVQVVCATYLIDIGTRYLLDRQTQAGSAIGRVETWLLPALEELLYATDK